MGLLNSNSLNEWAMAIPDRAKAMYQGLLNAPAELKQLLDPKFQQGLLAQRSVTDKLDKDKAMQLALDVMPGGIAAHTVYHGSPHKFDKFDMSKIGTGEGAQAYGHGLYFAENPDVAKAYQHGLSPSELFVGGKKYEPTNNDPAFGMAYSRILEATGNDKLGKLTKEHFDAAKSNIFNDFLYQNNPSISKLSNDAIKQLDKLENDWLSQGAELMPAGQMYKVDIPDESIPRMLDWDKPLSQQAPEVRAAILATKGKLPPNAIDDLGGDIAPLYDMAQTPGDFLGTLASLGGRQDFGEGLLKQAGIPGIRYLDGGSRNQAQRWVAKHPMGGENVFNSQAEATAFVKKNPDFKLIDPGMTSNYVLFDDALARILEINGQPTGLLPWAVK